jgi:hypothetical protein
MDFNESLKGYDNGLIRYNNIALGIVRGVRNFGYSLVFRWIVASILTHFLSFFCFKIDGDDWDQTPNFF